MLLPTAYRVGVFSCLASGQHTFSVPDLCLSLINNIRYVATMMQTNNKTSCMAIIAGPLCSEPVVYRLGQHL